MSRTWPKINLKKQKKKEKKKEDAEALLMSILLLCCYSSAMTDNTIISDKVGLKSQPEIDFQFVGYSVIRNMER